ncbi:hypothetical protein BC828DRAFT_72387 [Blastocladiella britannica]|nr:hypothetical protein BC828DRAFT_72387 [Blastocladiella britannica]
MTRDPSLGGGRVLFHRFSVSILSFCYKSEAWVAYFIEVKKKQETDQRPAKVTVDLEQYLTGSDQQYARVLLIAANNPAELAAQCTAARLAANPGEPLVDLTATFDIHVPEALAQMKSRSTEAQEIRVMWIAVYTRPTKSSPWTRVDGAPEKIPVKSARNGRKRATNEERKEKADQFKIATPAEQVKEAALVLAVQRFPAAAEALRVAGTIHTELFQARFKQLIEQSEDSEE